MICCRRFSTDFALACEHAIVWANALGVQNLQTSLTNFLRLFAEPSVTDVLINSPSEIWIEQDGQLTKVDGWFDSAEQLAAFAKAMVALGGNHLDFANPLCDVVLDQTLLPQLGDIKVSRLRVHCVLNAGVSEVTRISARAHRSKFLGLAELASGETLSVLRRLAMSGTNFVISGGVGAGKTTMLRAMLAEASELRTLLIEDDPELATASLPGHVISLTSREPNSDGRGQISMPRLLTEALRMRPDRLVVGEVRSHEIATLFQSLNLGVHQVAFTIHANSPATVRSRMLALWLASGRSASEFTDLLNGISITVVQLSRAEGARRVESIVELESVAKL